MRFRVTVRKLNVTDGRTDRRGALQYQIISRPRAYGAAGDNYIIFVTLQNGQGQNNKPWAQLQPPS